MVLAARRSLGLCMNIRGNVALGFGRQGISLLHQQKAMKSTHAHTLVLIRHGESEWNKSNRFTGWYDVQLSEKGNKEAAAAGQLLAKEGYKFDIAFTSVLKRAIRTCWHVLEQTDLMWIPVHKLWRLNERHYGALTGLDKKETTEKHGEAKVLEWRRSYDIPPPQLETSSEYYPGNDVRYQGLPKEDLPLSESLELTAARVLPEWNATIVPAMESGKNVLVAAHGNSLRALVKHLDNISEDEITELNIPTGIPLVYHLDSKMKPIPHPDAIAPLQGFYLGNQDDIRARILGVKNQTKDKFGFFMAQWRRFAFFDKEVLKDASGPWMKGIDITAMSANRGMICVGDADGFVYLANRQLEVRKFQAHEQFVSHLVMMKRSNILVSVGDGIDPRNDEVRAQSKAVAEAGRNQSTAALHDEFMASKREGISTAIVRLWRTDQQDHHGKPKLLQELHVFAKKYPEEAVTAFAVNDDISQFAVGLRNGAVILFRSDAKLLKYRQPHLVQPAGQYPVTGLHYTSKPVTATVAHVYLYASTRRGIMCYHCTHDDPALIKAVGNSSNLPPRSVVLDERGADLNCSCVNDEGEVAVGQNDAVYFYNTEDRSVCFAFEGEKRYLHFFKHYLLVSHVDARGRHQVNVYDLQNKFIAFNWTLTQTASGPGGLSRGASVRPGNASKAPGARFGLDDVEEIRHVVCEFGAIYVVSSVGVIYRLTERDTTSKLDILFRKNLYSIAISLAFSSNYDINSIMDIFRMYGDHLYEKGDYDGSLRQYARTIGHVEPSYVIRRFLDAQRIHNLTTYLEALHEKAFANAEHTTLLLNCYTKLKDVKKLDKFIHIEESVETTSKSKNTRDSASSAKLEPNEKGKDSNKLSSNVSGPSAPAFNFDIETAISVLWENYPQHALTLAKKHDEHSWYLKIQLDNISYVESEDTVGLSKSEQERVTDALNYIEGLSFSEADSNLRKYGRTLVTHLPAPTTELLKRLCTGKFDPSDPSLKSDPGDFLHLFVSHRKQLREFLEYIVDVEAVTNPSIGNTLLEMILSDSEVDKDTLEDTVMALLDNPRVQYDADHALIHLEMHSMKKGKRFLYNKLHMYHMLVQFHIEENDGDKILDEVKKHGEKDPNLWSLALKYFADRGPLPKGSNKNQEEWKELKYLLSLIDGNPAIPPLQVVQVLSQSKELPVSVVKQYIVNQLLHDEKQIEEDEEKIQAFKSDTNQMKEEIAQLNSKAVVFQATKCDLCNHDLDLPAVHFMCQHSFHLNCISETDRECLTCSLDHRHILGLKMQLEQKAQNHEQFYTQLESAADGFQTIAEYFGKGIFKTKGANSDEIGLDSRFSEDF